MQELEALEGKSLSELKAIAKALGIDSRLRREKLIERIMNGGSEAATAPEAPAAAPETPQSGEEAPRRARRPRLAKAESITSEKGETVVMPTAVAPTTPTPTEPTAPAAEPTPTEGPAATEAAPQPKRRGRKPKQQAVVEAEAPKAAPNEVE
ncbi:MAG: transcription termination factor Rho, partial [Rikenellaceae bacterium]|nr:transcription termination factor Rho [Rikenellaceae bacterium]